MENNALRLKKKLRELETSVLEKEFVFTMLETKALRESLRNRKRLRRSESAIHSWKKKDGYVV